MKNVKLMTNQEIKIEMDGLSYKMEYSVHRRHDAPELYKAHMDRFNELDNEYGAR